MLLVEFVKHIVVVLRVLEQLFIEQKNPLAVSVWKEDRNTISTQSVILKI
jgi:hypothetical protein